METEKKFKRIGLAAVLVAVLGLTIAFAALSQTLTINGTGKVASSTWDVVWEEIDNQTIVPSTGVEVQSGYPKLDNVSLVKDNTTKLTGTTLDLGTITLHKPGDNATFRINIANIGDINAKITGVTGVSVNNTYVEYSVKYLNTATNVTTDLIGRLLEPDDRKLVIIEVRFKDNVTTEQYNQIPSEGIEVSLNGVSITYTQDDGTGVADVNPADNCTSFTTKDTYVMGDVIALCNTSTGKSEDFYVISDNTTTVTALGKYNLLVGNNLQYTDMTNLEYTSEPVDTTDPEYGLQSSSAVLNMSTGTVGGAITFTDVKSTYDDKYPYWVGATQNELNSNYGSSYPAWVFDSNSNLWTPIQNYQTYIRSTLGKTNATVTLLSKEQADAIKTANNDSMPAWSYENSAYWFGTANDDSHIYRMLFDGGIESDSFENGYAMGVRPVITIAKSLLQ